jgi:chromosome segregation ATPase
MSNSMTTTNLMLSGGKPFGAHQGNIFSQVKQHAEAISYESQALKSDNDMLAHKLKQADARADQLAREVVEVTARNSELGALLKQEHATYEQLSFDQLASRTAIEEMQRHLELVEAAAARADRDAQSMRQLVDAHNGTLEDMRRRVGTLEQRIVDSTARAGALERELRNASAALVAATASRDDAVERLQRATQHANELNDALMQARAAAAAAQQAGDAARHELARATADKQHADHELVQALEHAERSRTELRAQLEHAAATTVAELKAQLQARESELDALDAALREAHIAKEAVERANELARQQQLTDRAAFDSERAELQAVLSKSRVDVAENLAQKHALQRGFDKHTQTLRDAHQQDLAQLRAEIDEVREQADELRVARDKAISERDAARNVAKVQQKREAATRAIVEDELEKSGIIHKTPATKPMPMPQPSKPSVVVAAAAAAAAAAASAAPIDETPIKLSRMPSAASTPMSAPSKPIDESMALASAGTMKKMFSRKKPFATSTGSVASTTTTTTTTTTSSSAKKKKTKSSYDAIISPHSVFAFDD